MRTAAKTIIKMIGITKGRIKLIVDHKIITPAAILNKTTGANNIKSPKVIKNFNPFILKIYGR